MDLASKRPQGMYEPLPTAPTTIRLLVLLRGRGPDPIQCSLKTIAIEPPPVYEALSYSWGDPRITKPIQVGSYCVDVTCNLELALKHLRLDDQDRTLWVDAICINQSDVVERGHQVSIMGQLYSQAKEVVIWLGAEPEPLGPVLCPFSFITQIKEANNLISMIQRQLPGGTRVTSFENLDPADESVPTTEEDSITSQTDLVLLAFGVLYMLSQDKHVQPLVEVGSNVENSFRSSVLNALLGVFQQPWWTRMWVVQEVVLAQEITVVYGRIKASWEMFALAGLGIERHRNSCCLEQSSRSQEFSDILTKISMTILEIEQSQLLRRGDDEVAKFYGQHSTTGIAPMGGILRQGRTKYCEYVWHTRHRDATDPRDKIYGVLGLIPNWISTTPIIPDYTVPSYHLFKDVVLKIIRGQQNFDILVGVQGDWAAEPTVQFFIENNPSQEAALLRKTLEYGRVYGPYLPSWVPDFARPAPYHLADRPARLLLVNALPISEVKVEVHDHFILSSKSLRVDMIVDVGPILLLPPGQPSGTSSDLPDKFSPKAVFSDWFSMAKTLQYFWKEYPLGGGSLEDTYMKTLCSGIKYRKHPQGNRRPLLVLEMGLGDGFYNAVEEEDFAAFEIWHKWIENSQDMSLHEYCQLKRLNRSNDANIRGLNKTIISSCLGRRFFVTANGYMGLGPPNTRPGDLVHVLFGSRTPFILRTAGKVMLSDKGNQKCHTLLGDCYVQGIMRSEYSDACKKVQEEWQGGGKDIKDVDTSFVRRFEVETLFLN